MEINQNICWNVIKTIATYPESIEYVRRKQFRVSDTQISYRQINSLESSGVIDNSRSSENKWRLFSFIDLLHLQMILACRAYGVKNEQLLGLKQQFFEKEKVIFRNKKEYRLFEGEYAILATFSGIRVGWMLFENGNSFFTDMQGFIQHNGTKKPDSNSYLYLNINKILKDIFAKTKSDKLFRVPPSLFQILRHNNVFGLTKKEIDILDIIREESYSNITIKKKSNGTINVYGATQIDGNKINEEDMMKVFATMDYSNIKIQKRDGSIVNYEIEDVFKF
jgi:hypothetical protein